MPKEKECVIRAGANAVRVGNVQKVKMEDGDILCVTVPPTTPANMLGSFRKHLEEDVQKRFGEKCYVLVVAAETGAVALDIAKRNELADIYQRLDALESRLEE
jgi:hypothetical protein